ncbi:MAG TPA: tetratricopeptide repeat protein [Terriglobales bacterium]
MRNRTSLLAAFLLSVSSVLFAQARPVFGNPTNSLTVQIRLSNAGDPLNLAKVMLSKSDMPLPDAYANSRGEVSWVSLPNGSYSVRVELPGYLPGEESVELMGGGSRHMIVMLHPDPNAMRPSTIAPEDPLVSAAYLAAPEKARKELDKSRESRLRGDCGNAVKHGKKAIELAPTFALAYVETGMCQTSLKHFDDARASFNTAIERDPKFLYGYIGLADLEVKQEHWNEAAQVLGKANQAHPDRAEPFYELSKIQLQTGHLDKAELAAKTALTKNYTRIPDLPFLLARIYVLEGKNDEAIKSLKEIADRNPDNAIGERARKSLETLNSKTSAKD